MAEEHCQIFPIMDLPAEVRTMIFKELLVMPSPILSKEAVYFQGKKRQGYRSKYPPFAAIEPVRYRTFTEYERKFEYIDVEKTTLVKQSSFLNLFLASKAIYREAMPIYFGCVSTFRAEYFTPSSSYNLSHHGSKDMSKPQRHNLPQQLPDRVMLTPSFT